VERCEAGHLKRGAVTPEPASSAMAPAPRAAPLATAGHLPLRLLRAGHGLHALNDLRRLAVGQAGRPVFARLRRIRWTRPRRPLAIAQRDEQRRHMLAMPGRPTPGLARAL